MRFKAAITLLCGFLLTGAMSGEPVAHRFEIWGTLQSQLEKLIFLQGWSNGFFHGPRSSGFVSLFNCMEDKLTTEQSIAMIDKYYKANPERWAIPVGNGIVLALTVKGSPCVGIDPWK